MPTLNEISYNILNIARSGIATDDDRISMRQIKYWVRYHRALIVKQLAQANQYLEPQYFQDMGCVELEEVDKASCPDPAWGCDIKKAVIPKIITFSRKKATSFIGLIDKQTPITLTTPNVVAFAKHKKYTNKMRRAYFINDDLYVEFDNTLYKDLKYINIRAIFEDPMVVNFCDESGGCSCLSDDDEYPLHLNMIEKVTQDVIAKEIRPIITFPNDQLNDAKDVDVTVDKQATR